MPGVFFMLSGVCDALIVLIFAMVYVRRRDFDLIKKQEELETQNDRR